MFSFWNKMNKDSESPSDEQQQPMETDQETGLVGEAPESLERAELKKDQDTGSENGDSEEDTSDSDEEEDEPATKTKPAMVPKIAVGSSDLAQLTRDQLAGSENGDSEEDSNDIEEEVNEPATQTKPVVVPKATAACDSSERAQLSRDQLAQLTRDELAGSENGDSEEDTSDSGEEENDPVTKTKPVVVPTAADWPAALEKSTTESDSTRPSTTVKPVSNAKESAIKPPAVDHTSPDTSEAPGPMDEELAVTAVPKAKAPSVSSKPAGEELGDKSTSQTVRSTAQPTMNPPPQPNEGEIATSAATAEKVETLIPSDQSSQGAKKPQDHSDRERLKPQDHSDRERLEKSKLDATTSGSASTAKPESVNKDNVTTQPPESMEIETVVVKPSAPSVVASDRGSAKPKDKPGREKKMQILSLVCEETMPPFDDPSLPVPVRRSVVRYSQGTGGATAGRTQKAGFKKRTAGSLTGLTTQVGKRYANDSGSGLASTPVRANTAAARQETLQAPPEVAFLERYGAYLTYDWSDLQLGTVNGSAAWNKALQEKLMHDSGLRSVPQVTPLDALQWVQQLQLQSETIHPNEQSELRKAVMTPKWMNERKSNNKHESATSKDASPMETDTVPLDQGDVMNFKPSGDQDEAMVLDNPPAIARVSSRKTGDAKDAPSSEPAPNAFAKRVASVYHDCLLQDVTDYRQDYQCMRASELVERMRFVENRAAGLHERGLKMKQSRFWEDIDAL